ncbi:MAG: hypothetical protein JST39_07000, partial [Bacteroidetes bacterium]|nr:hypothetical protein [Bacteroidota bacterium]
MAASLRVILKTTVLTLVTVIALLCPGSGSAMANTPLRDTIPGKPGDSLRFPISDRRGDPYSNPGRRSMDLKDPANITDSIAYDPKNKVYYIYEKVGNTWYRNPTYLTFDEVMRIRSRQLENDYFKQRSDVLADLNRKMLVPKLSVSDNLFNRIFGVGK